MGIKSARAEGEDGEMRATIQVARQTGVLRQPLACQLISKFFFCPGLAGPGTAGTGVCRRRCRRRRFLPRSLSPPATPHLHQPWEAQRRQPSLSRRAKSYPEGPVAPAAGDSVGPRGPVSPDESLQMPRDPQAPSNPPLVQQAAL